MKNMEVKTNGIHNEASETPKRGFRWKKFFKITAWTVMGIVLVILAMVMSVVNILKPERLTPILERVMTNSLQNAEVDIDRAELTVMKTFPFLHVHVDNIVVTSTLVRDLDPEEREFLPAYADTVAVVRSVDGGINVAKLLANHLDLSDVIITTPSANLVVIDEERTTFDIIPPSEDTEPFNIEDLPDITLRRFSIVDPGLIRYYDGVFGTEMSVGFAQLDLAGVEAPLYSININGGINVPEETLEVLGLPDLKFGLNGSLEWSRSNPMRVGLRDFDFLFSLIGGRINTEMDFTDGFVFNTLDVDLNPLDVSALLSVVPEDIAAEFGIPTAEDIETTAKIDTRLTLKSPWNVDDLSLPVMTLDIKIPDCALRWPAQKLNLERFGADIGVDIVGDDLDKAVVDIRSLYFGGPATDIAIKGRVTRLLTDPLFDGTIDGKTDMSRFPPVLKRLFAGTLRGKVTAHVGFRGSPSMFNATDFHRLAVTGNMVIDDLYWLSADTVNMFDVDRVSFSFGTRNQIKHNGVAVADSLLSAKLTVDSAYIVHSGMELNIKDFGIGLASENRTSTGTRRGVRGMGGGMHVGSLRLVSKADSSVVFVRDVKGRALIRPYNGDLRTPEISFDVDIKRFITGDRSTRVIIGDAHTDFTARRIAKGKRAQRFTKIADSVHRVHPNLPPDSIYAIAMRINNEQRGHRRRDDRRVETSDSVEIIDWGTAPMVQKLLNLWTFEGNLTSKRAGLFTPYMPIRSRLREVDVTFNNDTLKVKKLVYTAGRSDFAVNGTISNIRRALSSRGGARRPLKIHFDVFSDTIDVNQLTDVFFAGAAYSASEEKSMSFDVDSIDEEGLTLDEIVAKQNAATADSAGPLLIPANIDAQLCVDAKNVRYSDIDLRDMHGHVRMFGGALNLDNLSARSDVGDINLSALYTGLKPSDLRFGFGLKLNDFRIDRFLQLVPAVDSLLPVMRDMSGIITADLAATVDVDRQMNLVLPTLDAALGIEGDSLVLLDAETFKSLSKWLFFKNKKRNLIDRMDVQMMIRDNQIAVFPFIFEIDRYRLGVQGWNDFAMNFKYHIAVLKSPIPFKFGINIEGNLDKYKIRLGGAKFGDKQVRHIDLVDTTRVNLMREITNVFRRGADRARLSNLHHDTKAVTTGLDMSADTLSHADSLMYIREGLIDAPDTIPAVPEKEKKGRKKKTKDEKRSKVNEAGISGLVVAGIGITAWVRRRKDSTSEE